MPAAPPHRSTDAAMLTWLAGDDQVAAAADRIWDATGRVTEASTALHTAQIELEAAADAYTEVIRASRIPAEDVERLGAALILRIGRTRMLAELDNPGNENGDHTP